MLGVNTTKEGHEDRAGIRVGLYVVERVDLADHGDATSRSPFQGISPAEVMDRYSGIDGQPWPRNPEAVGIDIERGLASFKHLEAVRKYLKSLRPTRRCDFLVMDRAGTESSIDRPDLVFLGYDFGFIEGEDNVYSFLHSEVIHPRLDELAAIAPRLNRFLLADSPSLLADIRRQQVQLEARGVQFETTVSPETCEIFSVFKFSSQASR